MLLIEVISWLWKYLEPMNTSCDQNAVYVCYKPRHIYEATKPPHFTSAPSSVLTMFCRWNVYPCPCSVNGDNNVMSFASSKQSVALTWVRRDADREICELSCPKELTTVEMDKWKVVWKLQTCWSQQCGLTRYLHHDTSYWMVNYYVKLLRKPCRQILIHFLILYQQIIFIYFKLRVFMIVILYLGIGSVTCVI
jgi:hypothetical protein